MSRSSERVTRLTSPFKVQMMEGSKDVTVCWPDHPQALVDGVWRCLVDKYKVDVDVGCKGRLVQAHQLILGIFCPGLDERLRCSTDKSSSRLQLDCKMEGDDLELLIEFMYRGKVTVPRDRLGELQEAARELQLQAMNEALERARSMYGPDKNRAGARVPPRPAPKKTPRKRKGKPVKISRIPAKKRASGGDLDDEDVAAEWKSLSDGNDAMRTGRRRKAKAGHSDSAKTSGPDEGEATAEDPGTGCEERDDRGVEKLSQTSARKKRWRMNQPQLECPHCNYQTRDKMTYNSHMAKHDPSVERFTCETCSKTFRNQTSFRRHVRSHRNPEKLYQCTECAFRTPQRSTWLQHLAVIHRMDSEGRWLAPDVRCPQCEFSCFTEYQLKSHVARKHATDKPHKCPECSYASIARSDIEKHVRNMHRKERPYMCETCGVRSKTRNAFNMHVQSHSGLKPYKCDICNQAYTRSDKLKTHLLKHAREDGKFVCHACGQVCNTRDDFLAHLKCNHPPKREDDASGPPNAPTHDDPELPQASYAAYYGSPTATSLHLATASYPQF